MFPLGSLLLGHDKKWKFPIDEDLRSKNALDEANELVEESKNIKIEEEDSL